MYRKNEEAFTLVAPQKGLITDGKKKMDAVQVEAMISEAGLTKNNSRILFRHLSQFLGGTFLNQNIRDVLFLLELNFHLS